MISSYIVVALNMVREMIKRWWTQLKAATSEGNDPRHQRCSRYVITYLSHGMMTGGEVFKGAVMKGK